MNQPDCPVLITIRAASSEDAEGIAHVFVESAEYHAQLDPEPYSIPALEMMSARYRERRQHPPDGDRESITFVADLSGEIVGFIEARLEQSPDPMHRKMVYCRVAEIAVSKRQQNQGIGERLLRAAEDWARQYGATFAFLEYHTANTRASAFYQERMGYSVTFITALKRL